MNMNNTDHIGHQPWGKTANFSSIRKDALKRGITKIMVRPTVKLHGTNAAVRIEADGSVHFQSRNRDITPEDDNAGFAAWASQQDWHASMYWEPGDPAKVYYGEWVGRGIMKGAACCQIPERVFVYFATLDTKYGENGIAPYAVYPGVDIVDAAMKLEATQVLDLTDEIACQEFVNRADTLTAKVEAECPWTKEHFGISGVGEGLVWNVWVEGRTDRSLWFKTKGVKHREVKRTKKPGIDPEVFDSCRALALAYATDVRFEKIADTFGAFEKKNIGGFIKAVISDVMSESVAEREAAGLPDKQVGKVLGAVAAEWYKARC